MASTNLVKIKTVLTAAKRGGRRLVFKARGGEHKVKTSRSRTEVSIAGKPSTRGKLEVGMTWEVYYLGNS